jgi:serine/threonine-protein kinase
VLDLPKRYITSGNSASGGQGEVGIYQDTHLDRQVAIKSIKDISEQHRIIDELNALMQLRSKHVVQVFDRVIGNEGTISIIEEFIDGVDLVDLFASTIPKHEGNPKYLRSLIQLEKDRPTIIKYESILGNDTFTASMLRNYLKILWQIASGIADIHSVGVIHRDIKPNNMKVDKEGIVKIFDFGLSRNAGKDAKTQGFKGTFGYAAPELFKLGYVEFTQSVDTYAFGIIAIYLSGLTLPDELRSIPPKPISAINLPFELPIEVLFDFAALIKNCLAFNPDERPSMVKVRNEIARYLLKDKHQALAVYNNQPYVFNADNRAVPLNMSGVGNLTIKYDGFRFYISEISGEVFINNLPALIDQEIPESSVVTFGGAYRGSSRRYITFDISNPEVVL